MIKINRLARYSIVLIIAAILIHIGFGKYKNYKNSICRVQSEISFYHIECSIINLKSLMESIVPGSSQINPNELAKFSAVFEINKYIYTVLNNGYLISTDISKNKITSISKLDLENLDTSSFGGLISAVYIPEENLLVTYSLNTNSNDQKKYLNLTIFDTKNSFKKTNQFQLNQEDTLPVALGGGMAFDKNYLYLSVGIASSGFSDLLSNRAQDTKNIYGKIIQIYLPSLKEKNKLQYKIFSLGHKHSQGLLKTKNNLLEVEHSAEDGDELNNIKYAKNYGWNKFGYTKETKEGYKHYFNEHSNDYVDPVYFFTPEAAPSDIAVCPFKDSSSSYAYNPCVLVASLNQKAIFIIKFKKTNFFNEISTDPTVINTEKIEIKERVRKILSNKNSDLILVLTDRLTMYSLQFFQK